MIDKIIEISKEAGELIRDSFRTSFQMEYKTGASNLVTEIDKKSEKIIIDYVKKNFPGHGIMAEETGEQDKSAEYIWFIDPIDGTNNFAHGLPIFSVSIGVQKNGKTIAGVVYDVMQDIIYSCEAGGGAYANERKLKVSTNADLEQSMLVTGFPYDMAERGDSLLRVFGAFLKKARGIRRLGSAALDLCYVADGVFDGFWEGFLYPYDVCAGSLLVEEAGGKTTDYSGQNEIFKYQILATNGKVHSEMLEIINKNK